MNIKQVLFVGEPTKVESMAESYADSVHPSCRVSSKRAYMDGYLEAVEAEGIYNDEVTKKLSSSYSNLKVVHMHLKSRYNFLVEELRAARAALTLPTHQDKLEKYMELKKEFDGNNNY